jgi:predicted aspartyl protease
MLLSGAMPLHAASIAMTSSGGTYGVPVTIDGRITLIFTVDSGATDVAISSDVARTLWRAGALGRADFLGHQTYQLADGTKMPSALFRLRSNGTYLTASAGST